MSPSDCEPALGSLYVTERDTLDACLASCGGDLDIPPCGCPYDCGTIATDRCDECLDRCERTPPRSTACRCVSRCATEGGPAVSSALMAYYDCVRRAR